MYVKHLELLDMWNINPESLEAARVESETCNADVLAKQNTIIPRVAEITDIDPELSDEYSPEDLQKRIDALEALFSVGPTSIGLLRLAIFLQEDRQRFSKSFPQLPHGAELLQLDVAAFEIAAFVLWFHGVSRRQLECSDFSDLVGVDESWKAADNCVFVVFFMLRVMFEANIDEVALLVRSPEGNVVVPPPSDSSQYLMSLTRKQASEVFNLAVDPHRLSEGGSYATFVLQALRISYLLATDFDEKYVFNNGSCVLDLVRVLTILLEWNIAEEDWLLALGNILFHRRLQWHILRGKFVSPYDLYAMAGRTIALNARDPQQQEREPAHSLVDTRPRAEVMGCWRGKLRNTDKLPLVISAYFFGVGLYFWHLARKGLP